jgi:hypothetical protein
MYTLAYDDDALALVAVHGPGGRDDEDFPCLVAALARLADDAVRRKSAGRFLVFTQDGAVPPTGAERRQIAFHVDHAPHEVYFALVTRSGVHRTIMTAGGGLVAERRHRTIACATIEEAAAWMLRTTGIDSTALRRLLAAAETAALRMEPAAARREG